MKNIGLAVGLAWAVLSMAEDSTTRFQAEIDSCSAKGGGHVVIPAGRHLVGQLDLKSNVELNLARGAVLEGRVGLECYRVTELPYSEGTWSAVVSAIGVTNVAITGEGEIFGNGTAWPQPENYGGNQEGRRPRGVFFANCNGVRLRDFSLRDAACWGVVLKCCENVDIRRLRIDTHANANNDGIDLEARNVVIADCDIDAGDDAICLKSNTPDFVVENVLVTNVTARSHCNALKLGTASHGTMRNVLFVDCRAEPPRRDFIDRRLGRNRRWYEQDPNRVKRYAGGILGEACGSSSIVIENVDGGTVENVVYRNISVHGSRTPIFVRAGTRSGRSCGTPPSNKYVFRNVTIENVVGEAMSGVASSVTGVAGCRVKDVTLRNVNIVCRGCGETEAEKTRPVPEVAGKYPDAHMFGCMLPAYGLYVRHVDGLTMKNVEFVLRKGDFDRRAPIVLDDVTASSNEVRFLEGAAARDYMANLSERTTAWRRRIVESKSEYPATGTRWYVSVMGSDANDGRSPETAIASCERLAKLPLKAGDVVLFRRGDLFRGHFGAQRGVTYSAYGAGAKPVICGSRKNFARADLWKATGIPNVWTCVEPLSNVGLITFDHDPADSKEVGRFDVLTAQMVHSRKGVDSPRQLTKDLEFWSDLPKKALYLYSDKGNPGARFRQIEIAESGHGINGTDGVTIDNLHITLVGCHGVGSGTVRNLEVRNCIFDWLGGSLLIPEGKKGGPCRFGNAVEVYGGCDGYRVHDCWMYQIYDTGITHQCHHAKKDRIFQTNVEYARNLIEYCFWSIEYYNAFNGYGETRNVYVHDNHCRMGGFGWGCRGRAGGAPMFSIDDRPDKTVDYVNEGNILELCTGILVNNFGRHASPPEFVFRRNVYIQPRGWKFAQIGDRNPRISKFDESSADVIRETFGETDGTFVFIPEPGK